MSQCFIKSNGALKCITCHDPHNIQHGTETDDHYNKVRGSTIPRRSTPCDRKHTAETGCVDAICPCGVP